MLCFAFSMCVSAQELAFSSKVMGPVSNVVTYSADGKLQQVTDNIRWRDVDADISSLGAVAFSSNREESTEIDIHRRTEAFDIYWAPQRGGALERLTKTPGNEMLPRFSPDGRRLAYVYERSQLLVQALPKSDTPDKKGKSPQPVFSAGEILDFAWSPDGSSFVIAMRSETGAALMLLRPACHSSEDPGVSGKSGDHFPSNDAIPFIPSVLKEFPRLGAQAEGSCPQCGSVTSLAWSPDGERIAYILHPDEAGVRTLRVLALQGREDVPVSDASHQVQSPVSWSADNKSLLYSALVDYRYFYDERNHRKVYEGSMQVFHTDLDGHREPLAGAGGAARAPVFFGDSQIAYLFAEQLDARKYSLVVQDLQGGERQRIFDDVSKKSVLAVRN
ncbi:TolB family protein [Microbulbifer celer]|uniref:Uncharacterized protein n=1 Tax=Microbulbifer celer TaxID=435905 RepID=A0ABW3UBM2_9GAMM|nr:hypothetical protein [Microbulbifer celer]UFN55989.1 hypothetical protein LPW13_10400 [Microbulbifer celer]